jgi:hypothetical protein
MTLQDEVLKTDVMGRVRVKRARREALLDEFERSGASAQAFANLVGVKYQTFASWVQKRRRARKQYSPKQQVEALPAPPTSTGAFRLLEAVVESGPARAAAVENGESLCVHLPGGAWIEVRASRQAALAAELLKALGSTRLC